MDFQSVPETVSRFLMLVQATSPVTGYQSDRKNSILPVNLQIVNPPIEFSALRIELSFRLAICVYFGKPYGFGSTIDHLNYGQERNSGMPINSHCFSTLMFIAVVMVSVSNAQDSGKKSNPFEDMLRTTSTKISEDDVREIMAIRQRMGGGTKLDLDDFFTKTPGFAETDGSNSTLLNEHTSENSSIAINSATPAATMFMRHLRGSAPQTSLKEDVSHLRSIAKRMEILAADMEELDFFEDADLLRSRANKIRMKARDSVGKMSRQAKVPSNVR